MNNQLIDKLKTILKDYEEIQEQMQDPEVLGDSKKYAEVSKIESRLRVKGEIAKKYFALIQDKEDAEEIIKTESDKEMVDMFKAQIGEINSELEKMIPEIEEALVETDPADELDAIIEIEGKAGGDEANIFAGDLFEMYRRYASKQGLDIEMIEESPADQGGFSNVTFAVRGPNAYGLLRYESGIHRVQRVPQTETQGRVHTSTASVVVTPEVDSTINIEINPKDIRIDTYRSGGKGGQHANKTDSAVRITHLPTGIVATSQEGRSQHDNKDKAMTILKSRLYDLELQQQQSEFASSRKAVIGTGDRSEKIRTYNYPQNRLTDHRVGLTLKKLDRVMDGGLGEVIDYIRATIRDESKS